MDNTILKQWRGRELEIERLYSEGLSNRDIAKKLGMDKNTISIYMAGIEYLEHEDSPTSYLPDAEQIARECAEIRREWTPAEREQRRVVKKGE